jgi:hypothetical protein
MLWFPMSQASDPAPLPLSLNLGLFMHPGEQLSDLDSRRSLEPVLSVERQVYAIPDGRAVDDRHKRTRRCTMFNADVGKSGYACIMCADCFLNCFVFRLDLVDMRRALWAPQCTSTNSPLRCLTFCPRRTVPGASAPAQWLEAQECC